MFCTEHLSTSLPRASESKFIVQILEGEGAGEIIWPHLSAVGMLITATDKSKHFDWFIVGGFWRLSWFNFLQELFRPGSVFTGRPALFPAQFL